MQPLKIGVVGATGMVGRTFMNLIEERGLPLSELRPFASENSVGKKISVAQREWTLQTLRAGCFQGLDVVFFSSGDSISAEWAPQAVEAGAYAIDNSGAFRMHPQVDLIVPEVNAHLLKKKQARLIANPNCSTIQLVVALKPLSDRFGLKEVRVSSYQSVSGAGQPGYDELISQTQNYQNEDHKHQAFPEPILFNVIPEIGSADTSGFFNEEIKVMRETRKIMELPDLKISAFTVRVPSLNAHSEAVWVELKQKVTREQMIEVLKNAPGVSLQGGLHEYMTPQKASGEDAVYVGRVHQDLENPYLWLMWVVSDNLRKGAALNGIQIAEQCF